MGDVVWVQEAPEAGDSPLTPTVGEYGAGAVLDGAHVYPAGKAEPRPQDRPVTAEQAHTLRETLIGFADRVAWGEAEPMARIFTGVAAIGCVVGALPHRPPVWILGPSQAGKSSVGKALAMLWGASPGTGGGSPVGGYGLWYDKATGPAVRDAVTGVARPCVLDEFDMPANAGGPKAEMLRDLVDLMRRGFAPGSTWAVHGRRGRFDALFAAIAVRPPPVETADANRRVVLDVQAV